MTNMLRAAGGALASRLRRLDERLHIDHGHRGEWIWLAPFGTLLGTVALVCAVGVTSGVGAALYAPIGVLLGVVMAGMSIAYMTPSVDAEPGDDGGSPRPDDAPPPAPPWYRRLLEDATGEEPRARRREHTGSR